MSKLTPIFLLLSLLSFSPSRATQEEILISGKVVSFDGQTASGATASLYDPENLLAPTPRLESTPIATAQVAPNGHFVLAAPDVGLYTVRVEAPGRVPWEYPLPLVENTSLPTVTLGKAAPIELRLFNKGQEKQAIENGLIKITRVHRFSQAKPASGDWLPAKQLTRSNEDGRLTLKRNIVQDLNLLAWAPGYTEVETHSGKGPGREIRLHPGIERTIEIRYANGKPAKDVEVCQGRGRWSVGRTDEKGRLRIHAPAQEPLTLELLAADSHLPLRVSLLPSSNRDKPTVFYLEPISIRGRLISATSQSPIANALIWFSDPGSISVRSNAHGEFEFETSGPFSEPRLIVETPGHLRQGFELSSITPLIPIELVLQPAMHLAGRVIDEEGHPVPAAEIQAHDNPKRNSFLEPPLAVAARSDEKGRFHLRRLPRAPAYELIVKAPGFATMIFSVQPETDPQELQLILRSGQAVHGSVLDAAGQAIANAGVLLYPATDSERERLSTDDLHLAHSQTDGGFAIANVLTGRYDLGVSAPGFAPTLVRGLDLQASPRPIDLGTVYLETETLLKGRITDPDGQPLRGASLSFLALAYDIGPGRDRLSTRQLTRSDGDGRFVLRGLRSDQRIDLRIQRQGFRTRTLFGLEPAKDHPLNIVLESAVSIAGQVIDRQKTPIPEPRLVLTPEMPVDSERALLQAIEHQKTLKGDERGRFLFEDLEPGRYRLRVTAEGFLHSERRDIELSDQPRQDLEIELDRGATLLGQVLDEEERPVANARLTVVSPAPGRGEARLTVSSLADGSYELAGLARQPTTIEIVHAEHPRQIREIEISEPLHHFDFTLERGFNLVGRVIDEHGDALAGANLRLGGSGQARKNTWSEVDGSFRFLGVPAGNYLVRAEKKGFAEAEAKVQLLDSGSLIAPLELQLESGISLTGQILGLESADLEQVVIVAVNPSQKSRRGTTHFMGDYRVDHLRPGTWTLEASLSDGRRVTSNVELHPHTPETFLDIDFTSGLTVSGEIRRTGLPAAGALVDLVRTDLEIHRTTRAGLDGHFELTGLPPGLYELRIADFNGGSFQKQNLELKTDHQMSIDLEPSKANDPCDPFLAMVSKPCQMEEEQRQ